MKNWVVRENLLFIKNNASVFTKKKHFLQKIEFYFFISNRYKNYWIPFFWQASQIIYKDLHLSVSILLQALLIGSKNKAQKHEF